MVILHLNLHASQTHPLIIKNHENEASGKEANFQIKVTGEKGDVTLKKYNSNSYDITQNVSGETVSFDKDFYHTFILPVEDLQSLKVPVTLYDSDNEEFGSFVLTRADLHEQNSYGSVRCDIIQADGCVGTISLDYLVLPSEVTYDLSSSGKKFDASFDDFVYIGHRGDGATMERSLPYLENTLSSFLKAQQTGASFVELDVQLTKDHVPIIFHDDFVAVIEFNENGNCKVDKVPVKELTYEEIRNKKLDFARGHDIGLNYDDRFKDLFPTLKEMIEKSPANLGIFMEIKYPEPDQEINNLIPKDVVVERILEQLSRLEVKQPLMFCSFDPEICLMLRHKQNTYSVFYITVGENCFTSSNPWEPYDMRTRTRKIAAHFAICHDLKGISINADPLMNNKNDYKALTTFLKENGKLVFSWGKANCHREYAKIQKSVQLAGVISDRLSNLEITTRHS